MAPPTPEDQPPRVRVRVFASLREAMGWGEQIVTASAAQPTPLTLWCQLNLSRGGQEGTQALPPGVRVAVNQRFATPHTPLADGDELAFLPPITGG